MSQTLPAYRKAEDKAFVELRLFAAQLQSQHGQKVARTMLLKAIIFPAFYVGCYAMLLLYGRHAWVLYGSYVCMGLLLLVIFLNLVHEAVHMSLFRNKKLNKLYIRLFDLMGANSFVWSIRHRKLHHNYPNVMGWDSDIEQSDLARVFPHGGFSKAHRNQHLYLPFLYPLYLFNWLFIRDFKDFFS